MSRYLIIINAIIWALVILLASYFVKEAENYKQLFSVLIVAAILQNGILLNAIKKGKSNKSW